MNRILSFILFFSVFFTVYLAMHFYVFWRMSLLLGISRNIWFYAVMAALALSFPVTSLIERFLDGPVCRLFYTLAATWLGAIFLMLCLLVIYEAVRVFVRLPSPAAGIAVLSITLVLVVYGILNAAFIKVNEVEVPMSGLDEEMTLVQLSDIHLGTIHDANYLRTIVDKTNALEPDLVLITGDLVDGSGRIDGKSLAPFKDMKAKMFFSTGNHETYEGIDFMIGLLNKTNVHVLRNQVVHHKGIQIVGMDNPGEGISDQNINLKHIKFDRDKPAVLMYHPPLGFADAAEAGIDLQLSGHTHAGQIFPFSLFTRMFYRYTGGLYEKDGAYLYVSPGTGTWGPPMRIGSRSEITLIRLVKE
ncbi:metallophosphoesterase [Candidatus Woesearchaeota archaeon]|nr:metallophosphoesterase [Candidatus Woesearchaeota archaeon]